MEKGSREEFVLMCVTFTPERFHVEGVFIGWRNGDAVESLSALMLVRIQPRWRFCVTFLRRFYAGVF